MAAAAPPTAHPRGSLGVGDTALIVVGNIVGAGIFLVSPYVAQDVRSPAAFIATWLLGGAVALSGALSNGELGGIFPRSGGEYVYLREAYGSALGFLSGWTSFWIGFPGSIAALAAGFGATVAAMLHLQGPAAPMAIGLGAILASTLLNARGLEAGKWAQNALSAVKLAAFVVLLALGWIFARDEGFGGLVPFFAATAGAASGVAGTAGTPSPSGGGADASEPGGIAVALIPVLFAYSGWNAATYVTGEMRDPGRGLGKALAIGTGLCVALYVAINVVYLRAMPLADLAQAKEPARAAALRLGGGAAAALLSPLVAICVLSSLHATILVGPRIYKAMADDGLFPAGLGRLHAVTGSPIRALAAQGGVAAIELGLGSFDQLLSFATIAIVAFSTLTVGAVFILRAKRPDLPRPFRVPFFPVVPGFFVVLSVWMLWCVYRHGPRDALVGLAIVATGLPAYFVFQARQRSRAPS